MDKGFYIHANVSGGYQIGHAYDSINLSYPTSKTRRGRIGYGVAQTITCSDTIGVILPAEEEENENTGSSD